MRYRLFLLAMAIAATAGAQSRVFVSAAHGDDVNACTLAAPCRSFAKAVTVVATNGEVLALDSGGYGPVSIGISVSIVSPPGVEASITQSTPGQNGIDVDVPSGRVVLRGLSLFGLTTGTYGINVISAVLVSVQSCNVSGFASSGINFAITNFNPNRLFVSDSTLFQNLNGFFSSGPSLGAASFVIEHSRLEGNTSAGLNVQGLSRGAIRDSFVGGNSGGIMATTQTASQVILLEVENCTSMFNGTGIGAGGSSGNVTIHVSGSLVSSNSFGVSILDAAGHIYSRSNNTVVDNTVDDGAFTGTFSAR